MRPPRACIIQNARARSAPKGIQIIGCQKFWNFIRNDNPYFIPRQHIRQVPHGPASSICLSGPSLLR